MHSQALGEPLLVVAGEASGDLHAARLLTQIRQLQPGVQAYGLGSDELAQAGMEVVADSSEISVVGITEVARILPRARQIFRQLLEEVDRRRTRAAILVDFPDFNLRLAKQLSRRGVRVLYYISPQVWAWRRGRVRTIRRWIDRMMVILPFEVEFYERHGVEVAYVGHPLVDEVPQLPQAWDEKSEAVTLHIALLPGSRLSEIESNLPAILGASVRLASARTCRFSLIKASSVPLAVLEAYLQQAPGLDLDVVTADRFHAIARAHLAICASGTATLEVGLLGTPMVVVYRVSPWTYGLGRLLVRLPSIALVNLVLGSSVVPELLQGAAAPEPIAAVCNKLLSNRDRIRQMREGLAALRPALGDSGASRRAAEAVVAYLSNHSS